MLPRVGTFLQVAIVIASLAGAWLAGRLLAGHDGGWRIDNPSGGALVDFCGIPALPPAHCDEVVSSRWGSFDLYLGNRRWYVPTAFAGMAYFVVLAVWFGMAGSLIGRTPALRRMVMVLVSGGIGASLFLTGVMGLSVKTWCPPCLGVHLINGAVFVLVAVFLRQAQKTPAGTHSGATPAACSNTYAGRLLASALAVSLLAVGGIWSYYEAVREARRHWRSANAWSESVTELQKNADVMLAAYLAQPRVLPFESGEDSCSEPVLHKDENVPRLVVFANPASPASRCFLFGALPKLMDRFGGKLSVELCYAPPRVLSGRNPIDLSVETLPQSLKPCLIAEAARRIGQSPAFLAIYRQLLRHKGDERRFEVMAKAAGLDADALRRYMADPETKEAVVRDLRLAESLGVAATPTLFLEGRRVPDICIRSDAFWRKAASWVRDDGHLTESRSTVEISSETRIGAILAAWRAADGT